MKIRIVAPGHLKDRWLKDGIEKYRKRLSRFCRLEVIEVEDCPDSMPREECLRREGERILSHIRDNDIVWVMDLHGELVTSEILSDYLISDLTRGGGNLTIAIGGSNGIASDVTARASRRICFGNITLTHLMTRLILTEQLYRGFKIAGKEKYHK